MRIVLDTNILVSALITKATPPDRLYQAWLRNDIELVTSVAQIDEITNVLARPKLRRFVDPDEATQMFSAIHLRALVIGDMPVPNRSPDPKDDMILATAVAGQAALLVTGDKRDILALGTVEGYSDLHGARCTATGSTYPYRPPVDASFRDTRRSYQSEWQINSCAVP